MPYLSSPQTDHATDKLATQLLATCIDQTRIRNRRKRYLEQNPKYFSPELESADPLLYDRLVRRFFTPADREIERRQKGYAGTLEADLIRSEAKVDEVNGSSGNGTYVRLDNGEIVAQKDDDEELDRDEAYERWYEVMEQRFLNGLDQDFDYGLVDEDEQYDDRQTEERERQERWFDAETPDNDGDKSNYGKVLQGETGIQDF